MIYDTYTLTIRLLSEEEITKDIQVSQGFGNGHFTAIEAIKRTRGKDEAHYINGELIRVELTERGTIDRDLPKSNNRLLPYYLEGLSRIAKIISNDRLHQRP
jgi:hypothetical protein